MHGQFAAHIFRLTQLWNLQCSSRTIGPETNVYRFTALILALVLLPRAAAAQDAPERSEPAVQWEYAVYEKEFGPAQVLVVGDQRTRTAERDFRKFIPAIGGTPADVPEVTASTAEIDAAVLNVLGRQGWELVQCLRTEVADRDLRVVCYFKRARR